MTFDLLGLVWIIFVSIIDLIPDHPTLTPNSRRLTERSRSSARATRREDHQSPLSERRGSRRLGRHLPVEISSRLDPVVGNLEEQHRPLPSDHYPPRSSSSSSTPTARPAASACGRRCPTTTSATSSPITPRLPPDARYRRRCSPAPARARLGRRHGGSSCSASSKSRIMLRTGTASVNDGDRAGHRQSPGATDRADGARRVPRRSGGRSVVAGGHGEITARRGKNER